MPPAAPWVRTAAVRPTFDRQCDFLIGTLHKPPLNKMHVDPPQRDCGPFVCRARVRTGWFTIISSQIVLPAPQARRQPIAEVPGQAAGRSQDCCGRPFHA